MMKDTFHDALMRMQAELIPGYGVETAPHELTISAGDSGDFDVFGQVNGTTVRFTVDTGASEIVRWSAAQGTLWIRAHADISGDNDAMLRGLLRVRDEAGCGKCDCQREEWSAGAASDPG